MKWFEPYLAVMIIWWLSTQLCFMNSGHFVWLPWQHSILKNYFFKWQLRNHWSSMALIWYKSCLSKGNSNSYNYGGLPLGLVAMVTESSHWLIMGKCLNCIFMSGHTKWQVYYVILSEFLSVRPSVRVNIQCLGAIFGLFSYIIS